MSEIRPFRALRYDAARVDLERVISPPYDVIAPAERASYYEREPHNVIRLLLGPEARKRKFPPVEAARAPDYGAVAELLASWRRQGVLRRDPRPALYALRQRYRGPDGSWRQRDGFFALLRLEPYERGVVLPHERTLAAPKADRLELLRATRTNLSAVFLIYEDRECELDPLLDERLDQAELEVRDDRGVAHRLVAIEDRAAITAVRAFLAKRAVVIADGHHRYETALAYRDERRRAAGRAGGEAPHDWVLAYFANAFSPGSELRAIHRVVRGVPAPSEAVWRERFGPHSGWTLETLRLERLDALPALLAEHLDAAAARGEHAFAIDDGSGWLRVFRRPPEGSPPELTVRRIHRELIEGLLGLGAQAVREGALAYESDPVRAADRVRRGDGTLAIYLAPLRPEEVFRVTAAGERLPQKSTYFYPKIPAGLVLRALEPD